jgi:hypothetical protein
MPLRRSPVKIEKISVHLSVFLCVMLASSAFAAAPKGEPKESSIKGTYQLAGNFRTVPSKSLLRSRDLSPIRSRTETSMSPGRAARESTCPARRSSPINKGRRSVARLLNTETVSVKMSYRNISINLSFGSPPIVFKGH